MDRPTIARDFNHGIGIPRLFDSTFTTGTMYSYDVESVPDEKGQVAGNLAFGDSYLDGELYREPRHIFWFNFPLVRRDWILTNILINSILIEIGTGFGVSISTKVALRIAPVLIPFNPDLTWNMIDAWSEGTERGQFQDVNKEFDTGSDEAVDEQDTLHFEIVPHKISDEVFAENVYGLFFDLSEPDNIPSEGNLSIDIFWRISEPSYWFAYPKRAEIKPRLIAKVEKIEQKVIGLNLALILTLDIDVFEEGQRQGLSGFLDITTPAFSSGGKRLRGIFGVTPVFEDPPDDDERVLFKVQGIGPSEDAVDVAEQDAEGWLYFYY